MRWLVLLVLVAGCRKEPAAAPRTAVETPDAGVDPCVAKCVKDNQMKATSIENIERECVATCAGTP
jgi:hypothetical protein